MIKKFLLLLLACCYVLEVAALTPAQQIYRSYVEKDRATWLQVIDSLEALPHKTQQDDWQLLNFEYGYIPWCLTKEVNDKKQAEVYLRKAYDNLEKVAAGGKIPSMVAAYRAAFVGYEIALSPIKAPFIGSGAIKHAKEALQLDSLNYFAHLQMGNIYHYVPAFLGGSVQKAIAHYQKAEVLMQQAQLFNDNWLYMNLLLTLADAYKKQEKYDKVEAYYQRALQLEPNYPYIVDELYPSLRKKMGK